MASLSNRCRRAGAVCAPIGWNAQAGFAKALRSQRQRKRSLFLYTSTFSYEDKHFGIWYVGRYGECQYDDTGLDPSDFNRPYLVLAANGFGGSTSFAYHEEPNPKLDCQNDNPYWTREVVEQKGQVFGAGQPHQFAYKYDYRTDSGDASGPPRIRLLARTPSASSEALLRSPKASGRQ